MVIAANFYVVDSLVGQKLNFIQALPQVAIFVEEFDEADPADDPLPFGRVDSDLEDNAGLHHHLGKRHALNGLVNLRVIFK